MVKLAGESIILRAPEPEDLDLLYLWENDTDVWHVSNTLTPFSRYTLKNYIENSHLDIFEAKQLRLMIELKDSFTTIGTIDLFDFDPYHHRAGIGILIGDKTQRGKGYAAEALDLVIDYCFDMLSLHQIYCGIGSNNLSSIHLFQSKKFLQCGERKDWLKTAEGWQNELLFQLIRKE
jgi:diamine N-acetyltransferase